MGAESDRAPSSAAFVGSIKWRESRPFSRADAEELTVLRAQVPLTGRRTRLIGVSRTGFQSGICLDVALGPAELLKAWR